MQRAGCQRVWLQSDTWYPKYRDGDDIIRKVATGCRDKSAAQSVLNDLVKRSEKIRSCVLTSSNIELGEHSRTPIADHIAEYIAELRTRGVNNDRIKTSETYLNADCVGCGFKTLRDLNADKLRQWLRSHSDMSAATYNWYATQWVAFGGWLTGKRIEGL